MPQAPFAALLSPSVSTIESAAPASETAEADRLLARGPFLAVLLQGLPLAIGLASHALINLVDLAMVGRLGADAVQATHVATTWNFLPMIVGQCVSTALLSELSRDLGDGDRERARVRSRKAQWFMVWLGLAVGIATALPAAQMVDATGVGGDVRAVAMHYLIVSNLGCLPMFVMMQTTASMRAAGEAAAPLFVLLGTNVLNLVLDYALLFGFEPLSIPSVGAVGAAYASVGSRVLGCAFAWWWLSRRRHQLSLRDVPVRAIGPVVRPMLQDAWPQSVQIGLRALLVVVLTVVVQQRFGDDATVSIGITTRLDTLVLFSSLGFANAATAFAGRAAVAGRARAARWAGAWALLQAMAFGAIFVVVYQLAGDTVVGWFLPEPGADVLALTALYFGTAAWSQVLGAGGLGAIGAVYGGGWMRAPMWVDLVCFTIAGAWLYAAAADGLRATYLALFGGMALVLLGQALLVCLGAWARRPVRSPAAGTAL